MLNRSHVHQRQIQLVMINRCGSESLLHLAYLSGVRCYDADVDCSKILDIMENVNDHVHNNTHIVLVEDRRSVQLWYALALDVKENGKTGVVRLVCNLIESISDKSRISRSRSASDVPGP